MRKATVLITLLLFAAVVAGSSVARQANKLPTAQAEALRALDDSAANLSELEKIHANTAQLNAKMSAIYLALDKKIAEVARMAGQKTASPGHLAQAVKQLEETRMSSNLQYLQLQNSVQNENRQFTMVSNIMKTKHDTVKNSISNIR